MRMLWLLAGAASLWAGSAIAGDIPLYRPPAAWAQVADVAAAAKKPSGQIVVLDVQTRVEGDTITTYIDNAFLIDTPQALTQMGTLGAVWMPDKGDLSIHRAELLRDGMTIDLLTGEKFQVLRREQQLEQRQLNGLLTATMPVSGARVGDVLRLSYSVSRKDASLGGQVQASHPLLAGNFKPGLARTIVSWPAARAVRVSAGPRVTLPEPVISGGYKTLTVGLPLPKPEEMPKDAPPRYQLPPVVEVTSFATWEDVSRTMAPLFDPAGTVTKDGPIAAEVAKIAAASPDPEHRIAAALQLVQDRISYFLNGMNGGNYVPQSPEKTWTARYGDCKAKALLLLAILHEMGIAAEPVLVSSDRGDRLKEALPMAGAFDHVIVRASVGGQEYWLDGTSAGGRLSNIGDVPPFRYGLPLRRDGAGLTDLPAKVPALPQLAIVSRIDSSAGIDFPALFTTSLRFTGPTVAFLQQAAAAPATQERDDALDGIATRLLGESQIVKRDVTVDTASGVGTITVSGIRSPLWDRSQKRAVFAPQLASSDLAFSPDRGRSAWREIPVALGVPRRVRVEYTVDLPDAGAGATLEGASFHGTVGGVKVDRDSRIEGGKFIAVDEIASGGGELPAAAIPTERAASAALGNASLRIKAAPGAKRVWDVRSAEDRKRLRPIEDTYAKLIAAKPKETPNYLNRANFLAGIGDFKAALRDVDQAIALDESADNYETRANVRVMTGDIAFAIADLRKAKELDSNPLRLSRIADLLGQSGHPQEGLDLVHGAMENPGDARVPLVATHSSLLAELGRKDEGQTALEDLLAERPSDPVILNLLCWYGATRNHALDRNAPRCNRALETSDWSPGILDSRAFMNLRLEKFQNALEDANAALDRAPGQAQTLLLRGVIRRRMGDKGGEADIGEALRRVPGLAQEYRGYGVLP